MYHRVTAQIFLKPFSLAESESFFKDREFGWSREQILECQMVFGGLPYFMELLNGDESFTQNLDRLLFRQSAILKDETVRLLEATLKKSPIYEKILQLLSQHLYGMQRTECQEKSGSPHASYSRAIEDLVKCGYITEYNRHYETGNPIYLQLVDPFLMFHYHFLSHDDKLNSYDDMISDTGAYTNWSGHAFETLCMFHISQIKKALGISGVKTSSYPWMISLNHKRRGIPLPLNVAL